jgi:hypothetical protein
VSANAILLKLIRAMIPAFDESRFTDEYWQDVHCEFRRHQTIAQALSLLGFFAGFLLPFALTGTLQGWDIGIAFGMMIIVPFSYQLIICGIKGFPRTYFRWSDYSTMMYAIPWRVQFRWMYCPILGIALICIVGRVTFPRDLRDKPIRTEEPDASANRNQPIGPPINRTSSAAGSGR